VKKTVYLSLGSNLGDRAAQLREAVARIGELGKVLAVSGFYETEPVEVEAQQPWFLNCAVAMATELMPRQFLGRVLAIERGMGRRRNGAKAPRTIDIDILLFGRSVVETPELTIPHPGLEHRRFVLEPLAEIAPGARHPLSKRTVKEMLDLLPTGSGVVRRASGK
jgi:2-amino-4-hydroxy-6-hydroxymethyldihydropteridine diphosphokinase